METNQKRIAMLENKVTSKLFVCVVKLVLGIVKDKDTRVVIYFS